MQLQQMILMHYLEILDSLTNNYPKKIVHVNTKRDHNNGPFNYVIMEFNVYPIIILKPMYHAEARPAGSYNKCFHLVCYVIPYVVFSTTNLILYNTLCHEFLFDGFISKSKLKIL